MAAALEAPRAAAELYLTGDVFDGLRAAEIGLVTRAVEADGLEPIYTCSPLETCGPVRFTHGDHEFRPQMVCERCGQPPHGRDLQMELKNADCPTVGEALADLVAQHPQLKAHLYDEQGRLRSFVNVFRNDEDIRHLDREATPLAERDELSIVPSIAGGA